MFPGASITLEKLVCVHKLCLIASDRWVLFTSKVVFQWCEEMPDHWDAPGAAQEFLSGAAAHVGNVRVVGREAEDPLQLGAPQYVLLPIHQDRKMLVFPLFDGVGASSDGTHLPKLCHSAMLQTVLQLQLVHPRGTQRPVHAWQVSPEVSRPVSSRDLDSVDHHGVTLQEP